MKTEALKIHIEQLAKEVEKSLAIEGRDNTNSILDLIDCKEYLRRAWHTLDQSPFEANDTQAETRLRKTIL